MIEMRLAHTNEMDHIIQLTDWVIQQDERVLFFVAKEDGKMLGAIAGTIENEKKANITGIYVIPEMRRMRIGDGLLRTALNYLSRKGIENVTLHGENGLWQKRRPEDLQAGNAGFEKMMAFEALEKSGDDSFAVTLSEFFNRPCRGVKTKNYTECIRLYA